MPAPSATEKQMAIREAIRMREADEDPYYLAQTLLNQDLSIKKLKIVLALTEQLLEEIEVDNIEELIDAIATAHRIMAVTDQQPADPLLT
ncbi:hypothetical protein EDC56_1295 [Sinobacterium caligoides]|uniref:Uncharacterized protein n=1 Tax=Sinobacterium caligoides TaxID=933926 RepID=A0A3N2E0U1_9GAMM|nr:hypothetical protein [Sinobacterium caligoides]ROS05743.1 hypothetical protein EDC56_1295 [Sinobacterium caligoides]